MVLFHVNSRIAHSNRTSPAVLLEISSYELLLMKRFAKALFKRRAVATNTAFETFLSSAWEGNRW